MKKGMLSAKVIVGMIIAVIGIAILLLLLVALSKMVLSSHKKEQAEGQLKEIARLINKLGDSKTGSESFLLKYVPDYYLIGTSSAIVRSGASYKYNEESPLKLKMTSRCMSDTGTEIYCLCICKAVKGDLDCNNNGVCININKMPVKDPQDYFIFKVNKAQKVYGISISNGQDSKSLVFKKITSESFDLGNVVSVGGLFTMNFLITTGKQDISKNNYLSIGFEEIENEFYYALYNYFINNPAPLSTISGFPDDKRYILSHILMTSFDKYGVNPEVLLAVLDSESGLITESKWTSGQSFMGKIDVEKDDLCGNSDGLKNEINSLKNIPKEYLDSVTKNEEYLRLLNEITCGAKKINEMYQLSLSSSPNLEEPVNIGGTKVDLSQAYKDTLAIYYYLYGDKAIMAGGKEDLDIGKIEKFGLTYSKLKDYFSNDIGYKETSGFEDYRINYRDKAYFEK